MLFCFCCFTLGSLRLCLVDILVESYIFISFNVSVFLEEDVLRDLIWKMSKHPAKPLIATYVHTPLLYVQNQNSTQCTPDSSLLSCLKQIIVFIKTCHFSFVGTCKTDNNRVCLYLASPFANRTQLVFYNISSIGVIPLWNLLLLSSPLSFSIE